MRKNFKSLAFAAAAVAMLSACAGEISLQENQKDCQGVFTVIVEPEVESKTAFVDGGDPYVKWLSSDKIGVFEFIDGIQNACFKTTDGGTHLSDDSKTASFDVELYGDDRDDAISYSYTAVYPENGVCRDCDFHYFEIPAIQTLSDEGNFAADTDFLIGKPVVMESRISGTSNIYVRFRRPGTVVALRLVGISPGETISTVKLTAPSGNKIAGRCKVDLLTADVTEKAYGSESNVITLECNITATGDDNFYFRCLDGIWPKDSEVSVEVETDEAIYAKTVTLPEDYPFKDGGLTRFGFKGMNRRDLRCEKPKISIDGNGMATICCGTEGASLYYVLGEDPDDPTDGSTAYTGPVQMSEGETIKAIACASGMAPSTVVSRIFIPGCYYVTSNPSPGGSITVNDDSTGSIILGAGEEVTIVATAAANHHFVSWSITPELSFTSGSVSDATATFTMPESEVEVSAVFE